MTWRLMFFRALHLCTLWLVLWLVMCPATGADGADGTGRPNVVVILADDLRYADHAVEFIESHQEEPFFYFLSYNAPHGPLQAPDDVVSKFSGIEDEKRRTYAAMVHQMERLEQ